MAILGRVVDRELRLKNVLSDSMKGTRKVRRNITRSSLASGNDRIID